MDFALLDACIRANDGDFRALADWVEGGGALDECARLLIAARLRGTAKKQRGIRRTQAMRDADSTTLMIVQYLAMRDKVKAELEREAGRKYRAKGGERLYLDARPGMSPDTLKAILKRARADRNMLRNRVSK